MRSGRGLVGLTAVLTIVFAVSQAWVADLRLPGDVPLLLANTLPVLAIRWNPVVVALAFGVTYPLWLNAPAALGGAHEGHFMQSLPLLVALYAAGAWRRPLVRGVRDRGATVVLVTHFMEEAQALCDRVTIVDKGRVVVLDRPDTLTARHGGPITMTFSANGHDVGFLSSVPGVSTVSITNGVVTVAGESQTAVPVAAALAQRRLFPADFRTHHPTLEDVFLTTTGRQLRDPLPN